MKEILKGARARQTFIEIRSSFWFLPIVIVILAIALAIGLVELDRHVDHALRQWSPRWFDNEPDGARSVLQTIAGSMATVAGVVFSIIIVALTLAATQYTSRVLRNFMRDRFNQSMLGIFIGVYLYCLLVLRAISGENGAFVPSLALLGALTLTLLAVVVFIFFIHHVSSSIQASEMAKTITAETKAALDVEFPVHGQDASFIGDWKDYTLTWHPVIAHKIGYIQTIDMQCLVDYACQHDTVIRMECDVGDFVAPPGAMAFIAGPEPANDEMVSAVNRIYAVDSYRTIDQDAAFGFRQLVDISLKALSPGINDTTTAVTCIEHLSALLAHCAARPAQAPLHTREGVVRVVEQPRTFAFLVSLTFEQILETAKGNSEILLRLMMAIERVAGAVEDVGRIDVLHIQLASIAEYIERGDKTNASRRRLQEKRASVAKALNARKRD